MMRNLLFAALVFLQGVLYAGKTDDKSQPYPAFDAVVVHESIYLPLPADSGVIEKYSLAKKPEGWVWQFEKYTNNDWRVTDSKLCWSAATKKFVTDAATNSDEVAAKVKNSFLSYGVLRYDFERETYFGYRGWTDDVIHLLADSAKLCDRNLEALARAYSSEAFYRINQWSDFAVLERRMPLQEKSNCMSPAQLDTFRKYEHLSAATYLRLKKQNPMYETMVGGVSIKYSNEWLAAYLVLAYYQNDEEAMKELKDGLYDDFTIAFAKNLLNSCGRNGILITQGDNDTYPLYYVQAKYGYRRDVLVVNASLISTARYINYVRRGVFDAPAFPLAMPATAYAGDSLNYVHKTDARYKQLIEATGLNFDPVADYLYKGDVMFLSMIAANNWERPVYVSMSAAPEVALKMDRFFVAEGLAYRLTRNLSDAAALYQAPVNTDFTYPFLMKQFEPTNWKKQPYITDDITWVALNYQGIFSRTAAALKEEEKYGDCAALLNKYMELFPESKIPYTVYMVDMPALYAKSKHPAEAKALAEELTKVGNDYYEAHINNGKNEELASWNKHMMEALYILQQLVPFVKENYTDISFVNKCESEFNAKHIEYAKVLGELQGK